mmetsp:Transcript_22614/g.70048  ORF Transcript_22614/g.70048 Transcript_22614/m.70048 type:complete len:326 (-) Transcript_22614:1228-2205(-)
MGLSQSTGKTAVGCICDTDWYTDRVRAEAILTKWDGRADTWQRLSCNGRQLPEPRSGHSVERIGDACFVFGGYNEGHCMANLYRFDLRRYEWEALRPEGAGPEGRASHASCAIETVGGHGYYYVHGGSGAEWGRSSKNDLFCYHTKRRRWLQVSISLSFLPPFPPNPHPIVSHHYRSSRVGVCHRPCTGTASRCTARIRSSSSVAPRAGTTSMMCTPSTCHPKRGARSASRARRRPCATSTRAASSRTASTFSAVASSTRRTTPSTCTVSTSSRSPGSRSSRPMRPRAASRTPAPSRAGIRRSSSSAATSSMSRAPRAVARRTPA